MRKPTQQGEQGRETVQGQRGHHEVTAKRGKPPANPLAQMQHMVGNRGLGQMLQTKLAVSRPGDADEQEADRVAAKVTGENGEKAGTVQRTPSPVSGPGSAIKEAPAAVQGVLQSPGQPLNSSVRTGMEHRFGRDFSQVRVHTGPAAAESARSVDASAYTVGHDLVFGAGQYAPDTPPGRQLLAHELTHVLQPSSQPVLRRQPAATLTPAPAPTFSVDQAAYQQMVSKVILAISGNLVQANTLAPVIEPILQSLSSHAIWRDDKGKDHGGGAVPITLPGTPKVVLSLRLVLDDQIEPADYGEFQSSGKKDGTILVKVRKATDAGALREVLYHEASHLLVWVMQNWGGSSFANQDRQSVRALNLSLHTREIASLRNQLGALAASVNGRRTAAKQKTISDAELDSTATWLMGEAEVRAETKVFQLYADTQELLAKKGPQVFVDESKMIPVNGTVIDQYVFDFSKTFLPSDRAGLTPDDHHVLDILRDMVIGIVDLQVKRQFNLTPYVIGGGIPREQVQLPPAPLTPPSFRPLPQP